MKILKIVLMFILLSLIGCSKNHVNIEATKADVKHTVDSFFQAYFDKDFETFSNFFAKDRDILFLGTGENDYLFG